LFFIFHLLGEWREASAYRPLARLLRSPGDEIDAVLGDGITSTSHRVMAAVFDEDTKPLFDIVLDPEADEFVRSRMCEASAMVVGNGGFSRETAARFLADAFVDLRPQAECFVWNGWMNAVAMLGIEELKPLVRQAFDRGFISPSWTTFDYFERDLAHGVAHPGRPGWQNDGEYTLFGDTVAELSTWYCFTDKYKEDQERWRREAEEEQGRSLESQPHVNPFRNVGRNVPCPCGSGKKFKKCCLPRQEPAGFLPPDGPGLGGL
jgi:hypothetical protein